MLSVRASWIRAGIFAASSQAGTTLSLGQARASMLLTGANSIRSSCFAWTQPKRFWHAQSGNLQCRQGAQLLGLILKHRVRPDDQLFRQDDAPARKLDSIKHAQSCDQTARAGSVYVPLSPPHFLFPIQKHPGADPTPGKEIRTGTNPRWHRMSSYVTWSLQFRMAH